MRGLECIPLETPEFSGILCVDRTGGPYLIVDGDRKWWFEWSDYWGPNRVRKGGYTAEQPSWRSSFWRITSIWAKQGKRVEGCRAIWDEPPPATWRVKRISKRRVDVVECIEPDGYLDGLSRIDVIEPTPC